LFAAIKLFSLVVSPLKVEAEFESDELA
jgi:hypothetical protein